MALMAQVSAIRQTRKYILLKLGVAKIFQTFGELFK